MGDDRHSGWVAATTELGSHDPALQELPPPGNAPRRRNGYILAHAGRHRGCIVCASDTLALAAYQVMRSQGLWPGADIALMGLDDTDSAQELGLSRLHQPLAEIAQTLLSYLNGAESNAGAQATVSSSIPCSSPVRAPSEMVAAAVAPTTVFSLSSRNEQRIVERVQPLPGGHPKP